MNKRMVVLLIFLLVLVGIIIIGKQQEQANQLKQMELKASNELKILAAQAQKAKQAALEQTKKAEAEALRAKQIAEEKARKAVADAQRAKQMAKEAARKVAEDAKAKVGQLLAQATSLLDGGKYQQAIDIAKQILLSDPNNADAKSIIERATAMLKEAAQKQAEAITQGVQEQLNVPVPVSAGPGQ